jgi:two-component system OmpR family response regulator
MQRVRSQSACGILILTGRAHVSDRVMGLELGADDYVLKPFEPRELVARVSSILRRRETGGGGSGQNPRQIAEFSGWQFNLGNNSLNLTKWRRAGLEYPKPNCCGLSSAARTGFCNANN